MADRHIVPAGEENLHKLNSMCPCKPNASASGKSIWVTWHHKNLK